LTALDAAASDFSFLMNIVIGMYLVLAGAIAFVGVVALGGRKSPILRGCVWGTFAALAVIPVYVDGGNGDSTGPPLYHAMLVLVGGDLEYVTQSVVPFLIAAPTASLVVSALLLVIQARLPNIDHRTAVAGFERAGFKVVNESDQILMENGARRIAIPKSDPVNAYTMGGLVIDAGLSLDEFKNSLSPPAA
jgi:hypothetical protein